jgi:hypothetical protein
MTLSSRRRAAGCCGDGVVLWVHLVSRVFALALIAMVAFAYYWSVDGALSGRRPCVASPSPVVMHVSAGDVAYARSRGWPTVLYRGDPLRWSLVSLDRSPAGRRVERRSRGFCPERRFRLASSSRS